MRQELILGALPPIAIGMVAVIDPVTVRSAYSVINTNPPLVSVWGTPRTLLIWPLAIRVVKCDPIMVLW